MPTLFLKSIRPSIGLAIVAVLAITVATVTLVGFNQIDEPTSISLAPTNRTAPVAQKPPEPSAQSIGDGDAPPLRLLEPCQKASDLPYHPATLTPLPLEAPLEVYIRPSLTEQGTAFYLRNSDTDCVALLAEAAVGPSEFESAFFHSPDILAIRDRYFGERTFYFHLRSNVPWLSVYHDNFVKPRILFESSQYGYGLTLIREVDPPQACHLDSGEDSKSVTILDFALDNSPLGLLASPRIFTGPSACWAIRITGVQINRTLTTARATFENLGVLDIDLTPIYAGAPPRVTRFEPLP